MPRNGMLVQNHERSTADSKSVLAPELLQHKKPKILPLPLEKETVQHLMVVMRKKPSRKQDSNIASIQT